MILRPATDEDAELLFAWANDPETRRQSFTTDPIPWDTHVAWLERVLADRSRRIWIGEVDQRPVGVVRLDGEVISLTVAPDARGRGFASQLIAAACRASDGPVVAEIRPENTRSLRAFAAAGFVEVERGDEVVMRWSATASSS